MMLNMTWSTGNTDTEPINQTMQSGAKTHFVKANFSVP